MQQTVAHPSVKAPAESSAPRFAGQGSLLDLEGLYDAHHRQALALAYRIVGNLADAEEVIQEVFLTVWRSGQTFEPSKGSSRAWLLTIVRNRSIDVLRGRRRRPSYPLTEDFDPPDGSDLQAEVALTIDGDLARRAVQSLPIGQRQVIELAYFAGLSHSEIAARLAMPLGTVKGRVRLALDHLRRALATHQGALTFL